MVKDRHKKGEEADAVAEEEDPVQERGPVKEIRTDPDGTRKLDGLEREYLTSSGEWIPRETYKLWSAQLGREIDPLRAWYLDMGHPPDHDVKEALAELQRI